ncbi:MAG: hypothetical protein NPIRA02_04500 [Nitrospirales bacterium]|nr:MAG: hypothetical protein NPIRA02_04500 [Nitrospirales bacterium]
MENQWPPETWKLILNELFPSPWEQFGPHKCFRWNEALIYVDAYYTVPCLHFTKVRPLIGLAIRDILPKEGAKLLTRAAHNTLLNQQPSQFILEWPPEHSLQYQTIIKIFPYENELIGFAHDLGPKTTLANRHL